MEIILSVVLGIFSFVCGQIFQQYVLVPIQEFARQRADTIYFAVHFKDFMESSINWDAEEKSNVRQMKAALIYSTAMIPFYNFLSRVRILGLPSRANVYSAAKKIAKLASIVNAKSGAIVTSDSLMADEIVKLLGVKIVPIVEA